MLQTLIAVVSFPNKWHKLRCQTIEFRYGFRAAFIITHSSRAAAVLPHDCIYHKSQRRVFFFGVCGFGYIVTYMYIYIYTIFWSNTRATRKIKSCPFAFACIYEIIVFGLHTHTHMNSNTHHLYWDSIDEAIYDMQRRRSGMGRNQQQQKRVRITLSCVWRFS